MRILPIALFIHYLSQKYSFDEEDEMETSSIKKERAKTAIKMLLDIFITEAKLGFSRGIDLKIHKDKDKIIISFIAVYHKSHRKSRQNRCEIMNYM